MPREICMSCNAIHVWEWMEAFDKFGFGDGDGLVMTHVVAAALEQKGYAVAHEKWGLHNEVITSICKDGAELIPEGATVGYDNPRTYLPADVVALLDGAWNEDGEAVS